ncbi:hypothetical protein [Actinomadura sp. WMMA1423]|uniref:hypothetical protein n=1 Tax=Actinomadura sp. WMMA1423 TaxID=2591108 RepID=UPI0011473530|nr:hypothetical protein [Actinomadura sp. WMMA1423]
MDRDLGYLRKLFRNLEDLDDPGARRAYLAGHRRTAAAHLAELAPLRKREPIPARGYTIDDDQWWRLAKLYALSRTSDYLLELSCPEGDPPPGFGITGGRPVIEGSITHRDELRGWRTSTTPGVHGPRRLDESALAVHTEFFTEIGLTPFERAEAFSPFHHEIFAVVQDETATQVTVEEVLWPGFWFGDLLFSRAGVRVRAPRHLIGAEVATTSTLYFTYCREPRPTFDLSHGWGSNSQWHTTFQRFYADEDGLHFNWDGEVDIGEDPPQAWDPPDEEYPLDQRRELLLHRCFVRSALPRNEGGRVPFDDRLSLTTAGWPMDPESIVITPRRVQGAGTPWARVSRWLRHRRACQADG